MVRILRLLFVFFFFFFFFFKDLCQVFILPRFQYIQENRSIEAKSNGLTYKKISAQTFVGARRSGEEMRDDPKRCQRTRL